MWTAVKNTIEKNAAGDIEVSVTYSSGKVNVNEVIRTSSPSMVEQMIKNRAAELEAEELRKKAIDDYIATASVGPVDLTPAPEVEVAVSVDTGPNPMAFISKRQELIEKQKDVDLGLATPEEFTALQQETIALKPQQLTVKTNGLQL